MKIAMCKFVGLANGGTEKYLQTIAILLKRNGYEVDYYYTNNAPIITSTWKHPDNDIERTNLMIESGINLISVNVEYRVNNDWINTDFFEKFNESNYDYIITAGNGESEFPYNRLKNIKIIHTVHGNHAFNQNNIHKTILLCKWQSEKWLVNGGDSSKLEIIPSIVYTPEKFTKTFREKYRIPKDAFVYGFHQRNDNSISSTISLEAYSQIQDDNTYFALLGGTEVHKNYVNNNNLKNVIFVDYTSSVNDIHDFLDGIDVYAHCRVDGEVCSASIIEAMYHKKPLISFPGLNMGHVEQLEDCGRMSYSVDEYKDEMIKLKNRDYYDNMAEKVKKRYDDFYDYKVVESKILKTIKSE